MKRNSVKAARKTLKNAQESLSLLEGSMQSLERAAKLIEAREGDIIVTGIGKSGTISEKISATLTSLGHRAIYLHPVDAIHGDIGMLSKGDVLIALSYSGESKEVVKLVKYAKTAFNVPVVSLTQSPKSSLGLLSDAVIEVPIGEEGSPGNLAPMASATASLVLGDMLASMLAADINNEGFAKLHPGGVLGLELTKVEAVMTKGKRVPIVKFDQMAKSVLKVISDKSLGVAGVVDKTMKLCGVITDGDIRRWLILGGDAEQDIASKMMTKNPKTILPTQSLKEALRLMEDYRITTLFVADKSQKIQGVVHIHDIIEGNIV